MSEDTCKHGHLWSEHAEFYMNRGKEYRRCAECRRQRSVRDYRTKRDQCVEAYGRACAYCGEDRVEYLAFDHVNDDGKDHRYEEGSNRVSGPALLTWMIKNEYPASIQLLCHNCNHAKRVYGEEEARAIANRDA